MGRLESLDRMERLDRVERTDLEANTRGAAKQTTLKYNKIVEKKGKTTHFPRRVQSRQILGNTQKPNIIDNKMKHF